MNTIAELRAHLFKTLDMLNDKDKPMDIERAKVVGEVAQVIINSAKAEVEFMKVTGAKGTGFIPEQMPNGITGITRHKLEG